MIEGTAKSGSPPNGYHPLPAGVACRCVRLWQDGKGNYWCCRPVAVEMLGSDPSKATVSELEIVQPAPAAMPGVEDVARAIYMDRNGYGGPRCKEWSALPASHKDPYRADARAVLALFAPILAEKEREIATFDSREAEWNEAIANSLQNEEDAHRKLEDAEAALAAERERADMAVRQMIKQNDRLAAIRAQGE